MLMEFDASAAFDCVLAGISIITCERVGLPRVAGKFMFSLLKDVNFKLITGFGTSIESFCNSDGGVIGQGVLQGSSSTAPLHILSSDISLTTYNKKGISHPSQLHTKEIISDKAVQYVDDKSQFLNLLGITGKKW